MTLTKTYDLVKTIGGITYVERGGQLTIDNVVHVTIKTSNAHPLRHLSAACSVRYPDDPDYTRFQRTQLAIIARRPRRIPIKATRWDVELARRVRNATFASARSRAPTPRASLES